MTTQFDMFEKVREELEKSWKRTEAMVNLSLKPQAPQVGQTPKQTVWTKNKAKLYRYYPQGEIKHATPILLVYALINRPYIMDLAPGNSLVEYLVGEGYDVFLLDWGVPGEEDAGMRLEDYVFDYLPRATKQVLKHSGAESLSLIGYCMGGVLSILYTAANADAPVKNLVLLTTPVDFADAGLYSKWTHPDHFNVDRIVDVMGNMPAVMLDMGGKLLKPMQNYMGTYMTLADRLHDEAFVESWAQMNQWIDDAIPIAGETYRQWIKEFYQGNKLVKGELVLAGKPVKLENICCSVLNVYGEHDHIVQTCQSTPLMEHISSTDAQILPVKAGHVGIVASRSARKNFFPKLVDWLSSRS